MSRVEVSFEETVPSQEASDLRRDSRRSQNIVCASLLLVLLAMGVAFLERTSHEYERALAAGIEHDSNLAAVAERYMVRILKTAATVGVFIQDQVGARTPMHDVLAERARRNDFFTAIVYCPAAGDPISSDPTTSVTGEFCASWRQLLAQRTASEFGSVVVGIPVTVDAQVAVPLLWSSSATDKDLVALLVRPSTLVGALETFNVRAVSALYVLRRDGIVLARWQSSASPVQIGEDVLRGLNPTTTPTVQSVGGTRLLLTWREVEAHPLMIMVATPEREVLSEVAQRRRLYLASCIVAAALLLSGCLYLLRLQRNMRKAAAALDVARGQLAVLNGELERQVALRTRSLERAYEDLESFSFSVAHDVRGPISAIRTFADVLTPIAEASEHPKALHYVQRIEANARHMSELADHLLHMGRLARTEVRMEAMDLSAEAKLVIANLCERQPDRAVEWTIAEGCLIMGDRILMRQVLENLLGNAWKFTARTERPKVSVEWSTGPEPGWVTVAIADNGAGFDAGAARRLGESFVRMHSQSEFPGTGVGLATVKRILRLHGGTLRFASAVGAGTTVFFTAPTR